jgi:hypothetical protein
MLRTIPPRTRLRNRLLPSRKPLHPKVPFHCRGLSRCFAFRQLLLDLSRIAAGAHPLYNQNFAVVRDTVPLDLKEGVTEVRFANTTAHVETDSVILERQRTDWKSDNRAHSIYESFEIKLRNHKKEPVEIRAVEHLYRWNTWEITTSSDPFVKTAAQGMEFRVQLKPDEEKTVTYTVHYSW